MLTILSNTRPFIAESLKSPIGKITSTLVDKIIDQTGIDAKLVKESFIKDVYTYTEHAFDEKLVQKYSINT